MFDNEYNLNKKFQDNLISTRLYVVINFTKESFRKT